MAIVLARVDDRVIHGQTTTRWMAVKPADAILVISDKIAADQLRCKVLKAAAGTLKLGIYTLAQGPQALEKAKASAKKFLSSPTQSGTSQTSPGPEATTVGCSTWATSTRPAREPRIWATRSC